MIKNKFLGFGIFFFIQLTVVAQSQKELVPHLEKQAESTRLFVDGKPFIVLGGELGNSTFTSVESMAPLWIKLKGMNLNTVLAPVYWELIEPSEGKFDFGLLDRLIADARKNDLKLVLLWFGSWKNSMSSHVPAWIKTNPDKYPRAKDEKGISQEILSPFAENNLKADLHAFRALMKHVKDIDSRNRTVIMVQPENEIGMLPSARDYHPLANRLFKSPVPQELLQYLQKNKDGLVPEFSKVWRKNGFKTSGTWEEIFGGGYHTDELFMAWYFAKFTEALVREGKEIYPLPMFVNAALIRPGRIPGEYPSAGPLPHLMDIWKAGAPSVDMLSPDFYNPDFEEWNDLYVRQANPLFVPEHRFDATAAPKALFAFGRYKAIGFSPFGIESGGKTESAYLGKAYSVMKQLYPLITSSREYKTEGVLLNKEKPASTIVLGDYEFSFRNSYTLGWEAGATNEVWDSGAAIIIQTNDREFYVAGSGIVVTVKNWKKREKTTGILKNEDGVFENEKWKVFRHLNGDQTHQGRHIRISHGDYSIQRLELYDYD